MWRGLSKLIPNLSRTEMALAAGPVVVIGGLLGLAHLPGPTSHADATRTASAWEEPERATLGCGALTASGDVDATCTTGVSWTYVGDAETTNNLGPRKMSYFRGSDGSMKIVSRSADASSPVAVQVGIQLPGQERYSRITQRMANGEMRLIDGFRYDDTGAYTMTVHDLSGQEPWARMVYDYREDGKTLRRAVSYLRDGSVTISAD